MPDALTLAPILFGAMYVLMLTFQKYRPFISLGAAMIFLLLGAIPAFGFDFTPKDALRAIDWNVLLMIAGMMGTVHLFIASKMPGRISDAIIRKTPNILWMTVALSLFAGIVSALIDNVATVLMFAPVALAVCRQLKISPVPAIICISVSSNLQGAATLVGDTTSILLAKAAMLDFMDFFVDNGHVGMFFIVQAGAILSGLVMVFMFRKERESTHTKQKTPVDSLVPSMLLLLTVLTLIAVSFIPYRSGAAPGGIYKPEITNGLICVFYFVIGLLYEALVRRKRGLVWETVKSIDYATLALLLGLFLVIGAVEKAGVIHLIGEMIASLSGDGKGGSVFLIYTVIVWMSVLLSAFIDNIPYTATMLPVVAAVAASIAQHGGPAVDPKLFFYGLLAGATLGGNLTPIGASANIAGLGILRREGYTVKTGTFMKYSVPFTLAAVTSAYVLLWLIWAPK